MTHLIQRLQIEQHYALVADADEAACQLPDAERKLQAIDETTDHAQQNALLLRFERELTQLRAAWRPMGGNFDQPLVRDEHWQLVRAGLAPAPPLRVLKPWVARVLVRPSGNAYEVMLLVDEVLPNALSRPLLLQVGRALRLYHESRAGNGVELELQRMLQEDRPGTPVRFEIVLLGNTVNTACNRARLGGLHQRFSPSHRIYITGALLDTHACRVWCSSWSLLQTRSRYFRRALKNRHESAETMRRRVESRRFSACGPI